MSIFAPFTASVAFSDRAFERRMQRLKVFAHVSYRSSLLLPGRLVFWIAHVCCSAVLKESKLWMSGQSRRATEASWTPNLTDVTDSMQVHSSLEAAREDSFLVAVSAAYIMHSCLLGGHLLGAGPSSPSGGHAGPPAKKNGKASTNALSAGKSESHIRLSQRP